MSKVISAKA